MLIIIKIRNHIWCRQFIEDDSKLAPFTFSNTLAMPKRICPTQI